MNEYDQVEPIAQAVAEEIFTSGDTIMICKALVAVTYHNDDWKWVQDTCLKFLSDENLEVSGVAATCLGHLARIHGKLEKTKVVNALRRRLGNSGISGRIEDALDDIQMFLK
jgi:hypothetical protein